MPASASIFDIYGFGARGKGMGNALTAAAEDYHAIYYNPAQLMERLEVHVGAGITIIEPQLSLQRGALDSTIPSRLPATNVGFHLGISTPLGGIFKHKVAFGVAFFAPLVRVTRAEFVDPQTPHFYMYENLPDKLIIALGGAGQPFDWLKIGLGMQVLADLDGSADFSFSMVDSRVTSRRFTIDLHSDLAVTAGLTVTPMKGLNFSVSYREKLDLAFTLPVSAEIEEIGTLTFNLAGTDLYTPHQVSGGFSWKLPWAPLTVAADVTFALWSHAPSPAPDIQFQINAPALQETDESIIDVRTTAIPLEAVDIVTPRVGLEYGLGDFRLRAGYMFRPTPIPRQVQTGNYADSDTHMATLGADWTFSDPTQVHKRPLTIGLALQATVLRGRNVIKSDPADATGDYRIGGTIISFGIDFQHDF